MRVRSATTMSAGRTVSMDTSANRIPTPPMRPNSLKPRKSASCSTNSEHAVVNEDTAMPTPVLTNVSSIASSIDRPPPRSSA